MSDVVSSFLIHFKTYHVPQVFSFCISIYEIHFSIRLYPATNKNICQQVANIQRPQSQALSMRRMEDNKRAVKKLRMFDISVNEMNGTLLSDCMLSDSFSIFYRNGWHARLVLNIGRCTSTGGDTLFSLLIINSWYNKQRYTTNSHLFNYESYNWFRNLSPVHEFHCKCQTQGTQTQKGIP